LNVSIFLNNIVDINQQVLNLVEKFGLSQYDDSIFNFQLKEVFIFSVRHINKIASNNANISKKS